MTRLNVSAFPNTNTIAEIILIFTECPPLKDGQSSRTST